MTMLPGGWRTLALGSLLREPLRNGHSAKATGSEQGLPTLTLTAVTNGDFSESNIKQTVADPAKVRQLWIQPGDIFIQRSNTPALVGTARLYRGAPNLAIFPDLLIRVRLNDNADPRYIEAFLQSPHARAYFRGRAQGIAGSMPKIDQAAIEALQVPLATKPEQLRVVEEVEKQLTRIDAGVAALRRVRANLKRYRASVLKAACEGRLVPTEAELARRESRDYEPASVLLQRILKERRHHWEATELAKLKAKGKPPTDDRWKAKYKDAERPDTAKLPTLPEGWCWASLVMLAELKGGVTKGQKRGPNEILKEVPYLRVANVQRGYLDLTEMKTIEATEEEIEQLKLVAGDVLFNEGGDRDKLGRGWIWRAELPLCIHQNHVFRGRLYSRDVLPEYVSWYGNSFGQKYFLDEGKQTTNLASINLTKLGVLPVPLPPVAEQARILEEVQRRLSLMEACLSTTDRRLIAADRLRQSILASAFSGTLTSPRVASMATASTPNPQRRGAPPSDAVANV